MRRDVDSRSNGLHRLDPEARRARLERLGLDQDAVHSWMDPGSLDEATANRMIENVIGRMALPVGIATNFMVDGHEVLIPFCVEESSIIAAASNMAKRCRPTGGFRTKRDPPLMIGQIQVLDVDDHERAMEALRSSEAELIRIANDVPSKMISLGGGCQRIDHRTITTPRGEMLILHLIVDTRDAMGANAVNSMCERIAGHVERLTGGRVHLRILSNLAVHRTVTAEAVFEPEDLATESVSGPDVIQAILDAHAFAVADPYRAVTNNKGVMNAISAIALACGQDWRAIEAACHAFPVHTHGAYRAMADWASLEDGRLHGSLTLPMAVGIVGGASRIHPGARANLDLMGIEDASELGAVMVAAGLAQNLGAMRALATDGIQRGHMRLHLRNMVLAAGATDAELELVANRVLSTEGPITQSKVTAELEAHRASQ